MSKTRVCQGALLLAALLLPVLATAEIKKLHGGDIPFPPITEQERLKQFYERHGEWPDPKIVDKEHPGFTNRMAERTEEVMKIEDVGKRWDAWMALAQARLVPSFTANQYEVVDAPAHIHKKLYDRFHEMLPTAKLEGAGGAPVRGTLPSLFFPQEELNYEVLHEMTPFFSAWAGVEVEPTAVYGVRVYREGQTLIDHVDVLETHVISGILHIDSDLDEPWPIQMDNARGEMHSADLKPGQLCFYESAKTFHQRMTPLKGRYYASIFMHYRPVGWNYTRHEARAMLPPWWSQGAGKSDRSIVVTLENNSHLPLDIYWIIPGSEMKSPDGHSQMQHLTHIPSGQRAPQNTFPGHTFVARSPDGKIDRTINILAHYEGQIIPLHEGHAEL
mmetsp:Transcript_2359/g.6853  ORF Transcript_2359/g.6853 Transcript_2359/m.6853 type:complete len:388 (+) Transcript_2359:290-1453(+)|eukprot:CAMPEP_0117674274 /NCGR_PEP_ID=MMETSP0804-20121206/14943_1 /TAXON_ID=1074897 /ORGANISM="Tetraselmis astigmatica, Strain CCMP880" /LENGTH=387 /DNA_ID=CAMNT_0005483117 /DNA_START=1178 /DNA_END=2341 /DNA_ORIENTATION=+